MFTPPRRVVRVLAPALALATGLALASCASTSDTGSSASGSDAASGSGITIGTTDKVTKLDPAGSYDNGTSSVERQVYGYLMEPLPGDDDPTPVPSLAESGEFTSPNEYTVKLKKGLTFANGHELTSSDVKFSFDRQLAINDANGPASLLGNLDSVETPDDLTVVFKLKEANDQTWVGVLNSPAGPIVDEEVFPADKLMENQEVAESGAFAGQYSLASFKDNELVTYKAFDGYKGNLGTPKSTDVTVKYYADASNLKLDVQQGNIDVAYKQLSATDIDDLRNDDKVQVVEGPGGEIRYLVFNLDTQPFGAKAEEADAAKAKAVRQAVAASIDRAAIAKDVYKDTYSPLYSAVASSMKGATEPVKDKYLTSDGGPDVDKAKKILSEVGITDPVKIALQYNPDHYGPSSGDEYAAIKSQLEATGLFTVDLQSTEWVQYNKDRVADVYPVYQLGWFPDFSDADNYLTPFFAKGNFVGNHFEDDKADEMLKKEVTTADEAERTQLFADIQDYVADELPTVPLLQGKQFAVAGKDVQGVTLDPSYLFRYGTLSK
ncbi:ABC transporter substrate-binding protein [uncultured Corynebacterium sp.]|uniref:ABC transporter substrate-binding protein n=1 Tax=uncultured Corynebacterium sp. TaxID=159447 RepID=UPI0025F83181|nr:ABC transporter substrate-binding protein [uncultured Corynebacterium sp.]